ncbi:hypothetical protein SAMN02745181_3601 [Rubritalea squalenifaciens DSM 18772]|uniref:HEAT repeat-containing protein n=1 Tax=Rubritalea squalenifaciens DSM 18772 TaxID=1123071 RepID=A0A1M6RHR9_9BACT|nr:HEAT repeat domain-containing protein [Rubritalea squalenifaciens]SHK31983.1 hypothetical protein SAMN02745181_3601 [Rubritalea squalenifaciens DSM 18772]
MSRKVFLVTLLCAVTAFAGFVGWAMRGMSDKGGELAVQQTQDLELPSNSRTAALPLDEGIEQMNGSELAMQEDLSSAIRALTDPTVSERLRLDLARRIDTGLESGDVDYLFGLFRHNPGGDNKVWWVVLNEIMQQMDAKGVGADRFEAELIQLVKSKGAHEVARDYAVQHLALWIRNQGSGLSPESSEAVKMGQAMQAIADTITDPSLSGTSIPGTAIMSLTQASRQLPEEISAPVWQRLDPLLSSMMKGETKADLGMRTSIVQAVALRDSQAHLPLIREMARDAEIDPSMRLTSIAALGVYRSEEDKSYLESIANSNDRFRYAAQSALKKFQN